MWGGVSRQLGPAPAPRLPQPRPCPPVTCVSDSRRRRPLADGRGGAGPGRPVRQLRSAAITTKGSAGRRVLCGRGAGSSAVQVSSLCGTGAGLAAGVLAHARRRVMWSERPGQTVKSSSGAPVSLGASPGFFLLGKHRGREGFAVFAAVER